MDNFDELNEPVISSSGRKRKIKAETFLRSLAKAVLYNGLGKAQCIGVITSMQFMITTTCLSGFYIVI